MSHLQHTYHTSPPCTGTTIVNRNLNASKLTAARLAYHRRCRRCVPSSKRLTQRFRHGGFVKNKFNRSVSGEQPRAASLPPRGTWRAVAPRLISRKVMTCAVSGCVVGQRLVGRRSGKSWPVCKTWFFQTDHPGLAGMLRQFSCPGNHQKCPTFVESRNEDSASLSATAS